MALFRLFFDEDSLDRAVISGAKALGFDCSSVALEGHWGIDDESQLTFAAGAARAIFTSNVGDFVRLHYAWLLSGRTHHGIVVLTDQTMPVGRQLKGIGARPQIQQ